MAFAMANNPHCGNLHNCGFLFVLVDDGAVVELLLFVAAVIEIAGCALEGEPISSSFRKKG